jgi:tetrahydromethanopterin S-methyltransferase subunit D
MRLHGPLGFLLFWVTALGVGTGFVLLAVGAGLGWLVLVAAPAVVLLLVGLVSRRSQRRR